MLTDAATYHWEILQLGTTGVIIVLGMQIGLYKSITLPTYKQMDLVCFYAEKRPTV